MTTKKVDHWTDQMWVDAAELANDLLAEDSLAIRNLKKLHGAVTVTEGAHRLYVFSVMIAAKAVDDGKALMPIFDSHDTEEVDLYDILSDHRRLAALRSAGE